MHDILSHFRGVRHYKGNKWFALCPNHNDENPSVEVEILHDKVLIHCFAGCRTETILSRLGLLMRDLFSNQFGYGKRSMMVIENRHPYHALDGTLLYESLRYRNTETGDKTFSQRRPDGRGGWIWGLGDVRRVLYGLPELERLTEGWPNRIVGVVEGEKKAEMLRHIGIAATATVCGAECPWEDSYSEYLSDKHVCMIPDNDAGGRRYAMSALGSLMYHDCPSVRLLNLDVGDGQGPDDWLDADTARRFRLYQLILDAPAWRRR